MLGQQLRGIARFDDALRILSEHQDHEFDVVVVGAGIGGLNVAARLSRLGLGHNVLVVEALERIGGRCTSFDSVKSSHNNSPDPVHGSSPSQSSFGQYDAGAQWVGDRHTRLKAELQTRRLRLRSQRSIQTRTQGKLHDKSIYEFRDGRCIQYEGSLSLADPSLADLRVLVKELYRLTSLMEQLEGKPRDDDTREHSCVDEHGAIDLKTWAVGMLTTGNDPLSNGSAPADVIDAFSSLVESVLAKPLEVISLKWFVSFLSRCGGWHAVLAGAQDAVIEGGAHRVVENMHRELNSAGVPVMLSCRLIGLDHQHNESMFLRLQSPKSNSEATIKAKRVVITSPPDTWPLIAGSGMPLLVSRAASSFNPGKVSKFVARVAYFNSRGCAKDHMFTHCGAGHPVCFSYPREPSLEGFVDITCFVLGSRCDALQATQREAVMAHLSRIISSQNTCGCSFAIISCEEQSWDNAFFSFPDVELKPAGVNLEDLIVQHNNTKNARVLLCSGDIAPRHPGYLEGALLSADSVVSILSREAQKIDFQGLRNPHLELVLSQQPTAEHSNDGCCVDCYDIAMVEGSIPYTHFGLGNLDDRGWGCAYRSLQMIAGWIVSVSPRAEQTFLERSVNSSHLGIYETLVACGDREPLRDPSVVASRGLDWLGSFEIALCLDIWFDISCRIIHSHNAIRKKQCQGDSTDPCLSCQIGRYFFAPATSELITAPIFHGGDGGGALVICGARVRTKMGASPLERSCLATSINFCVLDPHAFFGMSERQGDPVEKIVGEDWVRWVAGKDLFSFDQGRTFHNLAVPLVR